MAEPIIINNFDAGIADSPHKGFCLMRFADITSFPGALKSFPVITSIFNVAVSATFTANETTDALTFVGSIGTGVAVTLTTTANLPAGLSTGTTYYAIAGANFRLATTIANAKAGTYINFTDGGTGTHTIATINPIDIGHMAYNPFTDVLFMISSGNKVWYLDSQGKAKLLDGSGLSSASGGTGGLALLRTSDDSATYLFAFDDNGISVINVHATANLETPVWTTGWKSLKQGSAGSSHYVIIAQDNIIYYCDGRYIGSIKENAGSVFDPATGSTYTFNDNALDLPSGEVAEYLEELGINLLVAGGTFNKVYPWDRVSDSFDLPISVPESSIKRLKNIGNIVYIFAGKNGNIYTTQGNNAVHFKKIPMQIMDNLGEPSANPLTWGGVSYFQGALLFGIGVNTSGNSGIYLLYPDGRLVMINTPTSVGNAFCFADNGSTYYFGSASTSYSWSSGGIRQLNLETLVQSLFYKVATKTEKATFSKLEVLIAKPATDGRIRIGYRTDTSSSFTTIDTFTADSATTLFQNDAIGLIDIENIQIQIEIDRDIELVEVRLIP